MDLNKHTLQENLDNPKNIFGDFCSVENILNPEFNKKKRIWKNFRRAWNYGWFWGKSS